MSGIFWLASYPKSGNTWTRSFLINLLYPSEQPADINNLFTGSIASNRSWVEDGLGIEIDELSHDEIDQLRPIAYKVLAEDLKQNRGDGESECHFGFHKIHDAYTFLNSGEPLIPSVASRGVLYLVRNPLDVVVSYANHSSTSIEQSVNFVCNTKAAFCRSRKRQVNQLRQILLCWSDHVESWLAADMPKLVVRYEDLKSDSVGMFSQVSEFLKIDRTAEQINVAVEKCRFENLRRQEEEQGFSEKAVGVKNFFRKGVVGDWQTELNEEQVARVIEANRVGMKRMGYLDDRDNPVIQPFDMQL